MSAKRPEDCNYLVTEYINAGNVEAAVNLYEPTATFMFEPGKPAIGHAAIREAMAATIAGKLHQDRLIGEIQAFLTGARNSPPAERVLLTVLVTDIVGSTEKAAAVGDSKWKDLLQLHDAAVRRELKNFGGQEVNATGDGFVLAFTGPTRAIQCTQAIKQDLERLGLGMRAGLHTGECERRGGDLSGLAVHIASRILGTASSNSILVSSTVKDLVVGSGLKFDNRGIHSLKGVPGKWSLFSVVE